jgi:hypothetical protein
VERDFFGERFLEVLAVVLLGVATVGTAWCGLQSALWNGEQDELIAATAEARLEANRAYGTGIQQLAYDGNLIAEYALAVREGDERMQAFLQESLMRPALLPFLERWQAELESGTATPNILEDEEYVASLSAGYDEATARGDALAAEANRAGGIGDSYIVTTVLLAVALFFAGVTSSFRFPSLRLALLLGSAICIALAAVRLIDLPIAATTSELVPWLGS